MIQTDLRKILVIDDEVNIRETVADILELNGYDVRVAASGAEGIAKAHEEIPSLIICDVMMPEVSGYQVAESVRKNALLQSVPFVFLSAKSTMSDLRLGMNKGASDYLTKPFDIDQLLAVVEMRLQMASDTNEKLEAIGHSLQSAKSIQKVILPQMREMTSAFHDFFCIWKPRDTVSGDFYWFQKRGSRTYIAAADCTGHGVSAAMLSMVCFEKLNAIMSLGKAQSPGEILTEVNKIVSDFMAKDAKGSGLPDGMDIALCCIEHDQKILSFSGAMQPLYMIGKSGREITGDQSRVSKQLADERSDFIRIRGDRYSIGVNSDGHTFSEFTVPLNDGDRYFIFSDGYQDQFGGEKDRRFRSSQFRDLLFNQRHLKLSEQKIELEASLEKWTGKGIQTDDILVLGFEP